MYYVDDKRAAITEVQRFLFVIGQKNGLSHLSIDGFYTEETENAVREFQRSHSLLETGVVDRETFDLIYGGYREIVDLEGEYEALIYSAEYPMRIGDSGNGVSDLNILIRELARFYRDLPIPYGNFYSADTSQAVKMLQKALRKVETGETTAEFIADLKNDLKSRIKVEKG